MASSVVSQALVTVPWSASRCPPAKLGVSAAVSGLSSLLSSGCRISTSRVSFCPVVAAPVRRRSFVVRAEEDAAESVGDAAAEEVPEVEGEVEVEEAESGAVAVAVEEKPPRQTRVKLGDVMGILNKRAVEAAVLARPTPDIRPGDVVQLRMKVPHNTRRLARYRGIVISRQNAGFHTTIRIRRIIAGIGVEMTFPLYSPNLKEITVFQHKKVRRAKLYYLKDKLPRFSTFKFK